MKLISVETGRVVFLFPREETTPRGGLYVSYALEMFTDAYEFASYPDLTRPIEDIDTISQVFKGGRLFLDDRVINIKEFTIYTDGIVIASSSTSDAELIFAHAMEWSQQTLGLRPLIKAPKKRYLSVVVIELESQIEKLFRNFIELSDRTNELLEANYGVDHPAFLYSLSLSVEDRLLPQDLSISDFVLERRTEPAFEANRFFSQAPLPTHAHLEWLESFEKLIK